MLTVEVVVKLANNLEIETGPDGFIQSDNVHRAPVFTNRKGVFVAGFSGGVQTADQRRAGVSSAALAVLSLYNNPPEDHDGKAEIDLTGHCVRCLTCARVCPYGAISLNSKVVVTRRPVRAAASVRQNAPGLP